jgi:hypothetical protein
MGGCPHRVPRRAPGVMPVDIELRVAGRAGGVRAVDRDRRVRQLADKTLAAEVGLDPPALVVARRAP